MKNKLLAIGLIVLSLAACSQPVDNEPHRHTVDVAPFETEWVLRADGTYMECLIVVGATCDWSQHVPSEAIGS